MNRIMQLTAAEVRAVMSGEKTAHAILAPATVKLPDNIIVHAVTDALTAGDTLAICESVRVIDGIVSYAGDSDNRTGKVLPASAMPPAAARMSVIVDDVYLSSPHDIMEPNKFGYATSDKKLPVENFIDGFVTPIRKRGCRELANEIESELIDGRRVIVIEFKLDRADLHRLPKARRAEIKIR